jgi:hypothetical protein
LTWTFPQHDDQLPLPAGAAVALVQIAPDQATGLGKVIAEALVPGPQAQGSYSSVEKLRQIQPLAAEIVPALEPALQDNRPRVRQLTALQILCLQPDHAGAKAVLLSGMKLPQTTLRTQAAMYFWKATGDMNQVLQVLREALQTVKENSSQAPLDQAAELGSAAKPLVPQIQA